MRSKTGDQTSLTHPPSTTRTFLTSVKNAQTKNSEGERRNTECEVLVRCTVQYGRTQAASVVVLTTVVLLVMSRSSTVRTVPVHTREGHLKYVYRTRDKKRN